ncbi:MULTISPECIES: hypothetical protein [Streptomyces]|uniref:Uncharacterized protein n=1 Tax=Streptomyces rochei TaxID=1928 RepID=A0AAX3ZJD8_STRRO|nr:MULTISPECIES: hypothetical protein [Streptomyces]WMC86866.1 hypothetical protein P7W03_15400 [Streptomyces rochei]WMI58844.1 hypothetical protein RBH85_20125 [Streptomyces rochei]
MTPAHAGAGPPARPAPITGAAPRAPGAASPFPSPSPPTTSRSGRYAS